MKAKKVNEVLTPREAGKKAGRKFMSRFTGKSGKKSFSEEEVIEIIDDVAGIFGASVHYHKVKDYLKSKGLMDYSQHYFDQDKNRSGSFRDELRKFSE